MLFFFKFSFSVRTQRSDYCNNNNNKYTYKKDNSLAQIRTYTIEERLYTHLWINTTRICSKLFVHTYAIIIILTTTATRKKTLISYSAVSFIYVQ